MAERGSVVNWLRKYGAQLLIAGVAAATITALSVTTVTMSSGGSMVIDATGDLTIDGDQITKASGTENLTISVAGTTPDLILSSGDGITMTTGASGMTITTVGAVADLIGTIGGDVAFTSAGSAALEVTGGGYVNTHTAGVTISAASPGDDVAISAIDQVTLDGVDVLMRGTTSNGLSTASGGAVTTNAGGVLLEAQYPGDTVTLIDPVGSLTMADLRLQYVNLPITTFNAANTTSIRVFPLANGHLTAATLNCQTAPLSTAGTITGALYDGYMSWIISSAPASIEATPVTWTVPAGGAFIGAGIDFKIVSNNADAVPGVGCVLALVVSIP